MKPVFVKEWHGISLSSIGGVDKNEVPGMKFYADFYKKFFETHSSWDSLEPDWVAHKISCAKFVRGRLKGMERVLSVGCGIGVIEKYLLDSGVKGLEIQEISGEPLCWIRRLFADEAVHVGRLQECLVPSRKYDYIFLSIVDYCLNEQEWVDFLKEIKKMLNPAGRCLVITPAFVSSDFDGAEMIFGMKFKLKTILSFFRLYDLGQLIGWRRSTGEFQSAMISAGFNSLEQGVLGRDAMFPKTYWIEGENLS